MRYKSFHGGLGIVLLMTFASGPLFSQHQVKSSVFGSGGGVTSGADSRIAGTIGQPLIGPSGGADRLALAGFWYAERSFTSAVEAENQDLPVEFRLEHNYPNPFNPRTTISFSLPKAVPVRLEVYNMKGELLRTLLSGQTYEAGRWEVAWEGLDDMGMVVSSGIYVCRITAGEFMKTHKMTFLK